MSEARIRPQLARLWRQLEPRRRRQLALAAALLLLSGLLEMVSLAAVLPLLVALMRWGGEGRPWLVALFCLVVAATAAVRLANLWVNSRLAAAIGSDFSERALGATLELPYREHLLLDSSRLVALLAPQMRQLIQLVLLQALHVLSGAVLTAGLMVVLAVLAWRELLPALALVGGAYLLLSRLSQGRLRRNGLAAAAAQQELIRMLQDNLAGIRGVILSGQARAIAADYGAIDRRMRRQEADNVALTGLPRFVLEPLGMIGIAVVGAVLLGQGRPPVDVLPRLALLAFAAQRLLPLCQQVWAGWAALTAHLNLLEPLLPLLERPSPVALATPAPPLEGWRSFGLEGVSFRHGPGLPPLFEALDLQVERGCWLGVLGPSGCGKSTLLDLLLGLLEPEAGSLVVDGQPVPAGSVRLRRWQAGLAHVGAAVPLVPATVRANIQAGRVDAGAHDAAWLQELAEQLEITELLDRRLGEAGRLLSGGQRQRVGLARALYGGASVLVLDEATSALDLATERRLMARLRALRPDLTLLLVSHRQASLEVCDRELVLGTAVTLSAPELRDRDPWQARQS